MSNDRDQYRDDYLWDPLAAPDSDVAKFERLLKPYSAGALKLADRVPPLQTQRIDVRQPMRFGAWYVTALAASSILASTVFWYYHRLKWTEGTPWSVTVTDTRGPNHVSDRSLLLQVGDGVTTDGDQTASLDVARIGKVTVAENSSVMLIKTTEKRHRLELKYGRLHAKVWAPPMTFGVIHRDAAALDMGCEFEIQADHEGTGSLTVINGWVHYDHLGDKAMVPQGHTASFDATGFGTPLRVGAAQPFAELVTRLDALFKSDTVDGVQALAIAEQIAAAATDDDYLTLLVLMNRYRTIERSALLARVEAVLGDVGDDDIINKLWQRVPKQPKRWWVNWRDAL